MVHKELQVLVKKDLQILLTLSIPSFTLSSFHVPDYFGFQGRNFAKTDEPISLTHSCGHLLWHRMVFAEGLRQPEGNKYELKLLIIQPQNKYTLCVPISVAGF